MGEVKPESKTLTSRRDELIAIEKKYQKLWHDEKVFEVDPPSADQLDGLTTQQAQTKFPKFHATMAYPYMNGVLHAGHSFTLSKVEFATGFQRLLGKRALFPLGFHCTGMPIKACADKLVREIELYGKTFDQGPDLLEGTANTSSSITETVKELSIKEDITKFKAGKSKAVAKQGRAKHQYEIMLQLGVPRTEIHKFSDPYYWLEHFPPLCKQDCDNFGARIDWRRSMVTTDANPYYDSFVRWSMRALLAQKKILFGERYTIYSAKDGQPCMDHDRASGEGVGPQEYTAIKIEILEWTDAGKQVLESSTLDISSKKTFLVAATLRPETMYGQTCCFVSPKLQYGVFDAGENNLYICTERAFKNMSFQKLTPVRGEHKPLALVPGSALIGTKIRAPLSVYPSVFVLPMETILASKGTGIVTSVPSDSPDDYVTWRDLRNKPEYYHVKPEWLLPDPVPILETPHYGKLTAEKLVQDLKIQSPKDKDALAKAKELAYKESFYQGVMVIGEYKGERVDVAKPKVKADLINAKQAFVYNEPEGLVISRSGDECIVSLEDQWYTDYGEPVWRKAVEDHLATMNTYQDECRNGFSKALGWLKNWALSRTYGLGTRIPWDEQCLVESLSDSTVYMAYYTISHFLHEDIFGQRKGTLNIKAQDMTDNVWDYIFHRTSELPKDCAIPEQSLNTLRRSFGYFYPLDVNISGKDLVGNHLTFSIYVHVALFPPEFWPRGVRVNGHLLLNNEKMSKSSGNFLTLKDVTLKFGADSARIALADAGDTLEDANFDEANANAAILRLYNLKNWIEEILKKECLESQRAGSTTEHFWDLTFENEINNCILLSKEHYASAEYKAALKSALFDLQGARDYYRDITTSLGIGMHKDLILRYIEVQALLLSPIAPHFADFVWREALGHKDSIQNARYPECTKPVHHGLASALAYVKDICRTIREVEGSNLKKKKKGPTFDSKKPSKLCIYVASSYPEWQDKYIGLVRALYEEAGTDINFTPEIKQRVAALGDVKRGLQFVNHLKMRLTVGGESPEAVFSRKLAFDELATLEQTIDVIRKSPAVTQVTELSLITVDPNSPSSGYDVLAKQQVDVPESKVVQEAVPGSPGITLANL